MTLDNKPINFDINRNNLFNLTAKQFDTNGARSFTFRLLKNSIPFDLTGLSVEVGGKKPDKKNIFNSCTIKDAEKGIVELELTTQMQVVAGMLNLELIIFKGETRLSTIPFEIQVVKSVTDFKKVESSNEFGALNNALDRVKQYTDKIDSKADEKDLIVERKRIDSLVSIPSGTPNAAELIDGRVGADGTTYNNLGDAIRNQFKDNNVSTGQIRELLLKGTVAMDITSKDGYYLTQDGTFNSDERLHCKVTNKIYCNEGWVFSYNGRADALAVSYLMYQGNNIVSHGQHNIETKVTIPKGVDGIVFSSYNFKDRDVILNVSLRNPNIIIEDNLETNLESKIGVIQFNDEVRNVISYTNTSIIKESMTKLEDKYASVDGDVVTADGYCCYEIPVKEGEIYSYSGTIIYNLAPYHLCSEDKTIIVGGDKQQHSELTSFNYPYF